MRTGMHMSIQDYFKHRGLAPARSTAAHGAVQGRRSSLTPFDKVLSAAQSSTPVNKKGWTIQDYINRPVRAYRPVPETRNGVTSRADPHMAPGKPKHAEPSGAASKAAEVPVVDSVGETDRIQVSIKKAAAQYDLPAALIEAVVKAESDYEVRAVSPAGAQGLMQLMPATARELGVNDPFDVDQNIHGGARYLRNMLDRFKGDIRLALSAYNAGPGTVARFKGHVPYAETQNYIQRVMKYSRQLSATAQRIS